MPLYEYKCSACGLQFELLILPSSPTPACPSCASAEVEKLLSTFAVSSEASRAAHKAAAFSHNNKLNAKQEPDKARVQIDHPHQH